MPLTDLAVRAALPGPKTTRLFDGGGLYLEVAPSGGKWWRLKYRFAGLERRVSLGTFPLTSLKAARLARDRAKQDLSAGVDPGALRREKKQAVRTAQLQKLDAVAEAWLKHRASAWKPGTLEAIGASLRNDVFPKLGSRPISEIQPRDIRDVVQAIESRGAGETAGRVFQRLRAIFRYAVAHELTTTDPTYALKPAEIFKPRKVTHRASISRAEAPDFLRRLEGYDRNSSTQMALALLILTAVRPGELRGARWEEIDERNAVWRIPAERMKMATEHVVPLSKQSLRLLKTMSRISGNDAFVFPSPFYPNKPLSDGTLNSALARMGYKGMATAHGFRTLFSTCANESGWDSDVIEKQLAHEERDEVRGAYNRAQWLTERTELMQWWADEVDTLRNASDSAGTSRKSASRSRRTRGLQSIAQKV
jgi:integrase